MDAPDSSIVLLKRQICLQWYVICGLFVLVVFMGIGWSVSPSAAVGSDDERVQVPEPGGSQLVLIGDQSSDLQWVLDHLGAVSPEMTNYELKQKWGSIVRVQDAMLLLRLHELLEKSDPEERVRLLEEQAAWLAHARSETDKAAAEYAGGTFASVAACGRYSELVDERLGVLSAVQGSE
ncbi:MAG: hypothetical protein CMJ33_04505 [Phycisphaerae bacterium]|nr:hypothetical protein [Phycisphaerae bacterium]